jgi:hypothetical protein
LFWISRQAGLELGPDQREETDPQERDAARTRREAA